MNQANTYTENNTELKNRAISPIDIANFSSVIKMGSEKDIENFVTRFNNTYNTEGQNIMLVHCITVLIQELDDFGTLLFKKNVIENLQFFIDTVKPQIKKALLQYSIDYLQKCVNILEGKISVGIENFSLQYDTRFVFENQNLGNYGYKFASDLVGQVGDDFQLTTSVGKYNWENHEINVNTFIFSTILKENNFSLSTHDEELLFNSLKALDNEKVKQFCYRYLGEHQGEELFTIYKNIPSTQKIGDFFKYIRKIKHDIVEIDIQSIDYIDLVQESNINFKSIEEAERISLLLKVLHNIEFLEDLNQDLNTDITNLTLQTQIFFLKYLWEKTSEEFETFKQVLRNIENKEAFMTTFLACSKNNEIGDTILELAQYKGSEEIFESYAKLVDLQTEIESEDIDSKEFLKAILSRGEKLLKEAYTSYQENNQYNISEKFTTQLVKSGALVKAMIKNQKTGSILSVEAFNEISPDFHIHKLQGGDILKPLNTYELPDMIHNSTYKHPEILGAKEYVWLRDQLDEAYLFDDKTGAEYLKGQISKDLGDKNSTFYIMKEKNSEENDMKAICRIERTPDTPGEIYVGTHYVDMNYRGDFGFGDYVMKLGLSEQKNLHTIRGEATIHNTSLERHINYAGAIATKWNEADDTSETGYFELKIFLNKKYKTKNKKKFSDAYIKESIGKNVGEGISIHKVNAKKGEDEEYQKLCKNMLQQGFGITRLFYEKDGKKVDTTQTYLVFEKV